MKKWLAGLLIIGLFAVSSMDMEKVSADELNNKEPDPNKVYVEADEDVILEDGKTFVSGNGVTITSNKVTDSNKKGFASKSIGINATPPNGEWDYLGYSFFKDESKVFHSTGGDIKIYIELDPVPSKLGPPYVLQLREQDTFLSSLIEQIEIREGGKWELNVRGLNDGDNGVSELFIRKLFYSTHYTYSEWWD